MKTFIHLLPAPQHPGRFFCPRAPLGAGVLFFPEGLGHAWWRRDAPLDPKLLLQAPAPLANLIFATLGTRRLSLWVKFPWRSPLPGSLLLVVSLRRDDGSHLNLGWSPQVRTRADAVDFLSACPRLDAAWVEDDQALLDQRHGRLVSVDHYTRAFPLMAKEAA